MERFEAMAPDGEEAAENPATTSISPLGAMKASDATHIISVLSGRYCKAAGGEKDLDEPSDIISVLTRRCCKPGFGFAAARSTPGGFAAARSTPGGFAAAPLRQVEKKTLISRFLSLLPGGYPQFVFFSNTFVRAVDKTHFFFEEFAGVFWETFAVGVLHSFIVTLEWTTG
jgi:hypothetical protein